MNTETDIRRLVIEVSSYPGDPAELDADYGLLEHAVLDSQAIYVLVESLEEFFGIEVDDGDIVPENLESIAALARLVDARRS